MAIDYNKYAREALGPLDLSHLNTEREVSQRAQQTNWQSLQNQFKNLKEQLEQKRQQGERQYSQGLVNIAEGSMDRLRTADDSLSRKGLGSSGLRDLVSRGEITNRGEQVKELLDKFGDINVGTVQQEAGALSKLSGEEAKLAQGLSEQLGEIGQRDVREQMQYGQSVADIAGSKEARDMANELAAAQRAAAAKAASGSGGNTKKSQEYQDKHDEMVRRMAIYETLINPELDDTMKSIALRYGLDVQNPDEVIKAHTINMDIEGYNKKLMEEYEKELKNLEREQNISERDVKENLQKYKPGEKLPGTNPIDFTPSGGLPNIVEAEKQKQAQLNSLITAMGKRTPEGDIRTSEMFYPGVAREAELENLLKGGGDIPNIPGLEVSDAFKRENFFKSLDKAQPIINDISDYKGANSLKDLMNVMSPEEISGLEDAYKLFQQRQEATNKYRKEQYPNLHQYQALANLLYGTNY